MFKRNVNLFQETKNKVIYECENSVNMDLFSYFGIAVQALVTTHIFILFCMTLEHYLLHYYKMFCL